VYGSNVGNFFVDRCSRGKFSSRITGKTSNEKTHVPQGQLYDQALQESNIEMTPGTTFWIMHSTVGRYTHIVHDCNV